MIEIMNNNNISNATIVTNKLNFYRKDSNAHPSTIAASIAANRVGTIGSNNTDWNQQSFHHNHIYNNNKPNEMTTLGVQEHQQATTIITSNNQMMVVGGECGSSTDRNEPTKKNATLTGRDPLSHRIIEKRRRDRMNSCLADLSRLIPTSYLKKGKGNKVEKTEIVAFAIKHLKHLQAHKYCDDEEGCTLTLSPDDRQFRLGFQEALSEAMRFLVEIEGLYSGDGLCRRLMDHLHSHLTNLPPTVTNTLLTSSPSLSCPDRAQSVISSVSPSMSVSLEQVKIEENEMMDHEQKDHHIMHHNRHNVNEECFVNDSRHSSLSSAKSALNHDGEDRDMNGHLSGLTSLNLNDHSDHSKAMLANSITLSRNSRNFKKELIYRQQEARSGNGFHVKKMKSHSMSSVTSDAGMNGVNVITDVERNQRDREASFSSLSSTCGSTSGYSSSNSCSSNSNSNTSTPNNSHANQPSPSSAPTKSGIVVPVFALHPSGQYYVPLTLDLGLLSSVFENPLSVQSAGNLPILHPINLLVNFNVNSNSLNCSSTCSDSSSPVLSCDATQTQLKLIQQK